MRRREPDRRRRLQLVLHAVLIASIGCAPETAPCAGAAPIVFGSPSERYLGLDPAQARAIVEILGTVDGEPARCSGVLVDARHVLTAAHCDLVLAADDGRIVIGGEERGASLERHPELDLMVATLDEDAPGSIAPLAPLRGEVDPSWIDRVAVIAGFGRDERGAAGVLRFAAERVIEVGAEDVVVDGEGESGACDADSGGPLLARDVDGVVRVVGTLTSGSLSCRARGRYVRLDAARGWLDGRIAPPETSPCGTLGETGACFEGRAIRCEGERTVAETCETCGWSGEAGFRCIGADACGGIDARGTCDGDRALRCDRGALVAVECADCGRGCAHDPATWSVRCR